MVDPARLLSIGEFAAATQLTAKALRLYEEQGLLRPATVADSNGYRYYAREQVAIGRLIRAMRDMNLSLAQIAQALEASREFRPLLLRDFLSAAEQRYARERLAYQSALLMMSRASSQAPVAIEEQVVPAQTVAVFGFDTCGKTFLTDLLETHAAAVRECNKREIQLLADFACSLLEPLSSEEARLELLLPFDRAMDAHMDDLTVRRVPQRRCAALAATRASIADGCIPCTDALFDWFDQRAVHSLGHPEVVIESSDANSKIIVRWAFQTIFNSPESSS